MNDVLSNTNRRIRVFAFDPSLGRRLETLKINEINLTIPVEMDGKRLEDTSPGPVGEYLEVIDIDPASNLAYPPIDLNDSMLLARDGLPPDEANPNFHQQMVYAVAMTTISHFEKALGRVALWAPRKYYDHGRVVEEYVQRLRIYPHALREANAYYSPAKKALLFGYFQADDQHPLIVPGSIIFTCLSYDVIAHEVTHALLDGLHPRFSEGSNPDMLALHEAFADIVALFQHFSHPEVLQDQIARARGDLETETLLGQLAQEFGLALGRGGALRDALGETDVAGNWRLRIPDRNAIHRAKGPHARGAILVAAVFQAFVNIYKNRTADMFRIASNGSGIMRPGALHPDMVNRLANEAAKVADHILQICIRALDYCPPVDVTFGQYLRAIITADHDLYPEDERGYRVAILEAFIAWGLVPEAKTYSPRSLLWPTLAELVADQVDDGMQDIKDQLETAFGILVMDPQSVRDVLEGRTDVSTDIIEALDRHAKRIMHLWNQKHDIQNMPARQTERRQMSLTKLKSKFKLESRTSRFTMENVLALDLLTKGLGTDREIVWNAQNFYCRLFWGLLSDPENEQLLKFLGLDCSQNAPGTVYRSELTQRPSFEVHSVRMANRRDARGQVEREYVVEVMQRRRGYFDPDKQRKMDARTDLPASERGDFTFRRGCTLLIDAGPYRIRRVIRTEGDISDSGALERMRAFLTKRGETPPNAFAGDRSSDGRETFAKLHQHFGGH